MINISIKCGDFSDGINLAEEVFLDEHCEGFLFDLFSSWKKQIAEITNERH